MFLFESYFNTFSHGVEFCSKLGGEIAVPGHNVPLQQWKDFLREMSSWRSVGGGKGYVWSGYTDWEREGSFLSVLSPGLEMAWQDWEEGQPNDWGGREDCVVYRSREEDLRDVPCQSNDVAVVCQVPGNTEYLLRGVCLDSPADSFYVVQDSQDLLGFIQTNMILNKARRRWEIQFSKNNSLIAFTNETLELPVGQHQWHFEKKDCHDEGKPSRSLNLHISLPQPGWFCCSDGACIDSELVCDNKYDCRDRSDEDKLRCQMVMKDPEYDQNKPPRELNRTDGDFNTQIRAELNLLELISLDESQSTFCVVFSLLLQWQDSKLYFTFLKEQMEMNVIKGDNWTDIWVPDLTFTILTGDTEKVKVIDENIYIRRLGEPTLTGDVNSTWVEEKYQGAEKAELTYSLLSQATFTCPFSSIKFYPFGDEECRFQFYISGPDNRLTNISEHQINLLIPALDLEIGQYKVKDISMEKVNGKVKGKGEMISMERMIVRIYLTRSIISILLVTYLPTALMNIINQVISLTEIFHSIQYITRPPIMSKLSRNTS